MSATPREALRAKLLEYADMLERADVHNDMGLSMAHTDCADTMREAAALLASDAAPQPTIELCQGTINGYVACELQRGHDGPCDYAPVKRKGQP